MRNLIYLFVGLLAGLSSATAKNLDDTSINRYYDGSRYIFVEGGVEFSVYPDGEFDFIVALGPCLHVTVHVPACCR